MDMTRSQIQRLIGEGYVLLNEKQPEKTGVFLEKNDRIVIHIPPPEPLSLIPENIPLDILFEDEHVIVIDKPAGMVVHPSAGHHSGTLVHALIAHDPFLNGIGGKKRPGIVHRLDKNTSGVLIIAKNEGSYQWLQQQFKSRSVEKIYFALVDGHPVTPNGKIVAPIYRDKVHRKRMAIAPAGRGKEAETRFFLEKDFKKHTLLRICPITGRTHQIRVHLASIGLPITGDRVYGYQTPTLPINRHFLHAATLKITLPGEKEERKFSAPLPTELTDILNKLE